MSDPGSEILIPAWVDGALKPVGKLEAHQRALRHKAVSVFVFYGGRLLLQKRAPGKYHTPGLLSNSCCTHPHWGEDAAHCATRRLEEELGLSGLELEHRGTVEYRADVGGGLTEHEVVDVFVTHASSLPSLSPDPREVADTAWVASETLLDDIAAEPQLYTPWMRIYMDKHRDMVLGAGV